MKHGIVCKDCLNVLREHGEILAHVYLCICRHYCVDYGYQPSQGFIALQLDMNQSNISTMVKKLERMGYVCTTDTKNDVLVQPTGMFECPDFMAFCPNKNKKGHRKDCDL